MKIKLTDIELIYPSMFRMVSNPFNNKLSHRTAFKYAGHALEGIGVLPSGDKSIYNTNSFIKTAILPKDSNNFEDYIALSKLIDIARNCNMELDRLFRNMITDAVVETYHYHYEERQGVGLALLEINVDVVKIQDRILSYGSTGEV